MIPFKYISIKEHQLISDKLYDYVLHNTDVLKNASPWTTLKKDDVLKFVPELAVELRKIVDADIEMISIIHRKPKVYGGVHIDSGGLTRMLFPVRNCAGSYTKFFDLNGNSVIEKKGNEGDTFFAISQYDAVNDCIIGNGNPLKEIGAAELISPIVFDSGIAHGVYTNPDCLGPRLTATIAFTKDIKYLLQ